MRTARFALRHGAARCSRADSTACSSPAALPRAHDANRGALLCCALKHRLNVDFAQQFYLAIKSLVLVKTASKELERTAMTRSTCQIYSSRQLCAALEQVSNDPSRSVNAVRESRRAMTRRSHCDIVWRPAWRATAQQQRNRCRRGSLLTLRLSRNAKNEQQSGSHKTSGTAAKGLTSAEQRELYCSQEVLRLSRTSFPAGGVALTTCHRGST